MHKPICICSLPWSLATCPHSTPHHQFPMSTSASRCDYNDEYVAAVCLRVWHCDVSLLALTPSLSLSFEPPFLSPCLSLYHFLSFLSVSNFHWWDIPLASWISYEAYTNTQTQDHSQQQNNKHWAQNFQLIFPGGSSEVVHLTFWSNSGECRTGGAAWVMQTLCQ